MKIANTGAWILFVSRRFARVDGRGKNALTSFLASAGIAFGVMTLIVVMAVMNGFQSGYIESILELSSFHIRSFPVSQTETAALADFLKNNPSVRSFSPFAEAQALSVGKSGRQEAAFIRFVPENILERDEGFARQITLFAGRFDLSGGRVVIGSRLARILGVGVGDRVNLLALSGSSDTDLLSASRVFTVSGIFSCAYSDINASFMFFSLDTAKKLSVSPLCYGIKLYKTRQDGRFIRSLQKALPNIRAASWRTYNKSFFGALKTEKNVLMMLVFIIFVVVAVNIFNAMRRMIFERREEISVLSALGAKPFHIQAVFLMQGLLIGLGGAVPGLLLGMLISVRMESVFFIISKTMYYIQYALAFLFNPASLAFLTENSMFMFYAQIPARMFFGETAVITLFGILSALVSSYAASKHILTLSIAEVLRYE
ncbi:ABC transporter permease [Treponema sp. HNW]|uniref:ABC transporter permease n=1 Tax=Treponema sp. HNW TaxID=3116654 RepID=UPI003D145729